MERRSSDGVTESGFTLIELLIVIVVLGILAAIVVFSLTGVTGQSKTAACTSDAKSVEVAVAAYQAAHSSVPTMTDLTTADATTGVKYLNSAPGTGNGYDISITSAGTVQVAPYSNGKAGTATDFSDSTGCTSGQIAS